MRAGLDAGGGDWRSADVFAVDEHLRAGTSLSMCRVPPARGVSTGAGASGAGDASGFGAVARRAEGGAGLGVTSGAAAFGGSAAVAGLAGEASLTSVVAALCDSGCGRVRLNTTTAPPSSRRLSAMIVKV